MNNTQAPLLYTGLSKEAKKSALQALFDIADSQSMTKTMEDRIQSAYTSIGEFIQKTDEFRDIATEVYPQGSRAIGTTVRPIGREGYDIDAVMSLRQSAKHLYLDAQGPQRLISTLTTTLRRYADRHSIQIRPARRCVTLIYEGDLHADVAPVFESPLLKHMYGLYHGEIPDREQKEFVATNPKGYRNWFDQVAKIRPVITRMRVALDSQKVEASFEVEELPDIKIFERLLSVFAQVVKIHRNHYFRTKPDISPTSIFITTLIAKAYEKLAPVEHESELDLLLEITQNLKKYFNISFNSSGAEEWNLLNPTTLNENVASRMNTSERQKAFLDWSRILVGDVHKLVAQHDAGGRDKLYEFVEASFGSVSAKKLQMTSLEKITKIRSNGKTTLLTASGGTSILDSRNHNFYGVR